jgi:hypothetical protein
MNGSLISDSILWVGSKSIVRFNLMCNRWLSQFNIVLFVLLLGGLNIASKDELLDVCPNLSVLAFKVGIRLDLSGCSERLLCLSY